MRTLCPYNAYPLNMARKFRHYVFLTVLIFAIGCGVKQERTGEAGPKANEEPKYVTVQHILIGFAGSVPGKGITRTKEEAKHFAQDLLKRAKAGEHFDALVKEYTDDSYPGIYKMANHGVPADPSKNIFARDRMVPAFGNVGFPLAVGEIGMANYDTHNSPYGWHIIKRIE